ncbi:WecB/TagA/CpsF family glycosyltransferase [Alicyclobacillus cycloheptanicus]|uniref:N-acetylglucosaminyldiphosphoundecaprenol N-acetyl-beta-D-mannosaminyltransferase n=1 Tax=Alicyclobacillus cycloheptanicus TaxID=1457 RepID=A0ABT9XLC1_9BACL|nr:WecB/TagA/CpsF family glycosyltransferase [Alicyclobacillus cycloheptanicus]MDQ0191106.1 N-acetylglucosaminyldiphosphoundecaprenol N-acetyl-beta-D-mannosaminyltransferase [Alicyclobacillus cycloheptanicus]WDM02755.1 WecB/TagA/CpsF family glycosyltransferase [Alicyclobacillus cycloheptanicus]
MQLGSEVRDSAVFHVLGVRFDRLNRRQAVEQILHWIAERSRRMVITAGPEFVMMAQQDEQVQKIAHVADLVTPDGIGIVWAAKRQGRAVEERVTGVELVRDLLDTAVHRGQALRVFILGAKPEALDRCLENFRAEYPLVTFEGHHGYFSDRDVPQVIDQVKAFQPDLWLVGLGQPRQEQFIFQWLASMPPCVAIGVGGSIDVWGGMVKRAPVVFQKLNLEWLYRLLKQPSRWRRQLALPRFAWQVLRKAGQDA